MRDTICRLCLVALDPDDSACSVLDDRFRQVLDSVFTFQIRLEEDLPVHTCKRCSWNVLDFQSYSELVQRNQEKLEKGLLLNVQNKSTEGEDTVTSDRSAHDDVHESNVTDDFETLNSSQLSHENDPLNANASHTDNDLSLDDVEVAFEIYPDHRSSTMLAEDAENQYEVAICEEYLITANDSAGSDPTAMETVVEENILPAKEPAVADFSDADESAQKKKKISYLRCASAEANVCLGTHVEAEHASNAHASEKHPCEQCEKNFVTIWQLEYHKQEHMVLKCPFCQKSVHGKGLNLHVATHKNAFRCDTCNINFISQRDFKYHERICVKSTEGTLPQSS
uniref:Uncharacterized protein n=1 Tax=Anopheles minimus TaxID=112268 RepID=A0A182VTX0_9DIPT